MHLRSLLLFAWLVCLLQPLLGQCPDGPPIANLTFGFVDATTAVVYNTSEGGAQASWQVQGAQVIRQDGASLVMRLENPSDTAAVCLSLQGGEGCADQYCVDLYAGAPDDLCRLTDCVWPGDANGDGQANVYDLLHIGLGYGADGPQRGIHPMPENPVAWMPTFSDNWSAWIGAVNFKHLDCDGNGVVDDEDLRAIEHNYSPVLDSLDRPEAGGVPVYLRFDADNIPIDGQPTGEIEVFADLMVGLPNQPVRDLHGLALDIELPEELLESGSISLEAAPQSLFAQGQEPLLMGMDLREHGMSRFDLALSRHAQPGVQGSGSIATLRFVINSDIIGAFVAPEIPFELELNRVRLIDSRGKVIPYALPSPVSGPVLVRDQPELEPEAAPDRFQLELFPNPATQWVRVDWATRGRADLRLYDALGKLVLRRDLTGTTYTLPVGQLRRGVYLLRLETEEGMRTRHLMLR